MGENRKDENTILLQHGRRVFSFAGLWDRWAAPDGKTVESCSIITTTPNALVADVHSRTPVILQSDDYDLWLDPDFNNATELSSFLFPYDAT